MVRHGYWWNANDDTEAEVYWEFGKANTFGSVTRPAIAGAVCLAASQARYAELTAEAAKGESYGSSRTILPKP